MKKNRGIRKENFGNVWMLSEFFLYLQSVCDWASFYTCMKWLPCKEARKSCGHVQTIQFSKLKSGKFERRMNGSYCLSESTPVYGVDSSFIFSFLRVLPEPNLQESDGRRGSHHSFFSLMNHYELVRFANFSYLCKMIGRKKREKSCPMQPLTSCN